MHKQICHSPVVPVIFVLLCAAGIAGAQDNDAGTEDPADETSRCIDLRSLRRTDIIDDRNIMFHMRGDTVYHNILPRQCGGLAREDRFSYQTTVGRLCDLDMIRVLYSDPFGLREGNACQLGVFHKISKEDARAFKESPGNPPESKPLPMPAPQEIGEPEDDEASTVNDDVPQSP